MPTQLTAASAVSDRSRQSGSIAEPSIASCAFRAITVSNRCVVVAVGLLWRDDGTSVMWKALMRFARRSRITIVYTCLVSYMTVCVRAHARAHTRSHRHRHRNTCTHTHTHVTRTHAHVHTRTHAHTNAHKRTPAHMHTPTDIHKCGRVDLVPDAKHSHRHDFS